MNHLYFVLPDDPHQPSGGNVYNTFLLQALREKGLRFRTLDLETCVGCFSRGAPGLYFVDSLHLDFLPELAARRVCGQDLFVIIHHLPSLYPDCDRKTARRERLRLGQAGGFLVSSPWARQILCERGLGSKPAFVVPPAPILKPQYLPPFITRREPSLIKGGWGDFPEGRGDLLLRHFDGLLVANLAPHKGVLDFLTELAGKVSALDSFRLRLAGRLDLDRAYTRACRKVIEGALSLRRSVELLGPLSLGDLHDCYESSNVFVSASQVETFGLAVQDARAFGLPVLALNAGYVGRQVRDGINGRLYDSPEELAEGCLDLIRDPRALKSLRQSAYRARLSGDYTWAKAADLFLHQLSRWKSWRFGDAWKLAS